MLLFIGPPTKRKHPMKTILLGFIVGFFLSSQVSNSKDFSHRIRRIVTNGGETTGDGSGDTSPALSSNCNFLVNLTNTLTIPTITSPNYPFPYPPNTICRWIIRSQFGRRIQIQFDFFNMQPSRYPWGCASDYLEVTDLTHSQRFCGADGPPEGVYVSTGPQLMLKFVSDALWQFRGFSLRVSVQSITCGGISAVIRGQISSPNYPKPYPHNTLCAWKIQGPLGAQVKLNCSNQFRIEKSRRCSADSVSISVSGDDTMKNSTKFCGSSSPGLVYSVSNTMNVIFYSNQWRSNQGFSCDYEIFGIRGNSNNVDESPTIEGRNCDCGKIKQRKKRIIGGEEVADTLPWLAAITSERGRQLLCGGVLVSPFYVLTAAHCLRGLKPDSIQVILENFDARRMSSNRLLSVEKFILHEKLKDRFDYDVALLKIPLAYEGLNERACICLPSSNFSMAKRTAEVYGWGRNFKKTDDRLYKVGVPILEDDECKKAFAKLIQITPRMFCAGEAGKDACDGDSGGPLVVESEGRQTVVGIVSFGFGCGVPGYPGVYAKVTELVDWIRENAQVKCP